MDHALMHTHTCRYIFGLTSGVMCLDIHPENAFLVAVGLYDGKVAVYDFREVKNPVFQSDARTGKHTDPVWQVTGHNPCTWYMYTYRHNSERRKLHAWTCVLASDL